MQEKYTAFISYRHIAPDENVAKKLHTLIENYGIPGDVKKSKGISKMGRVFRDQEELPLSTDLGGDIRVALDNSDWLIVLCSPEYLESKWCNAELDYFISLGRRDRVLAILVKGEPEEAFPEQLRFVEKNGVKTEVEPLAGDVRADSVAGALKKLSTEKLRVLAPMLGVSYDHLRQRARRRRMKIAAAAMAAGFAVMGGFLTYALIKNGQITRQNEQITSQNQQISRQNREISEQRDMAVTNQMQLMIERANISAQNGDKLVSSRLLSQAADLRETVGEANDQALRAALENSVYTSSFETVLNIDNDNRKFDSIVFSHDDSLMLGVTNHNSAALIDANTGRILYSVARSDIGRLDSVGFTKDDKYFYTVDTWFNYVNLYRVDTGEPYHYFHYMGDYTWQIGEKVFPVENNKLLIVLEKNLVLWDYEADKGEDILPCTDPQAFAGYLRPLIVDLSPDESSVVVGSHGFGAGMKIYGLDGVEKVALESESDRGYSPIAFSGDGGHVAAGSGNMVFVWDAHTGKMELSVSLGEGYTGGEAFLINYDGSVLLVMSSSYLGAVEVSSGRTLWEKTAESNIITEADISPDGRYVCASGGITGIFDIRTGETLSERDGTAFSNDGRKVICGTYTMAPVLAVTPEEASSVCVESFTEELFKTERYTNPGVSLGISLQHDSGVYGTDTTMRAGRKSGVFISPDTGYLAATHYDGFIEVFDITDKDKPEEIYCLAEHCYYSVEDIIFSGDRMASCGGYDPRCMIFDLASGQILHVLAGMEYVHKSEFSPDGSKIAILCGRASDMVLIYDVETGNLLYTFSAPQGTKFTDMGFNLPGNKAVGLLSDGRAMVGELCLSLEELISKAAKD